MGTVAAGIVHFNETRDFSISLSRIVSQVDHLIIVDNNSDDQWKRNLSETVKPYGSKVEVIWSEKNVGCSGGHNLFIKKLLTRNDEWMVFFNLDSLIDDDFVMKLRKGHAALESEGYRLGGVGPIYFDTPAAKASATQFHTGPLLVESVITSGHFMRMSIFQAGYLFNEQFFVDYVDHEFCLRLSRDGFQFFLLPSVQMVHTLGSIQSYRLLGRSFFSYNYGAFRIFDQYRGRVCLYKNYFLSHWGWVKDDFLAAIKNILKVLLFESNKLVKLKAFCRGICAGILQPYIPPPRSKN
jgi:rhamnosyltransferase